MKNFNSGDVVFYKSDNKREKPMVVMSFENTLNPGYKKLKCISTASGHREDLEFVISADESKNLVTNVEGMLKIAREQGEGQSIKDSEKEAFLQHADFVKETYL